MPIYRYNCKKDGPFELLLPMSESDKKRKRCPRCRGFGIRMAERYTARPDTLWSGVMTEYGMISSSSKLAQIKREKGIVEMSRDEIHATAAQGKKDREARIRAKSRRYFEDAISGSGIVDSFGQPTPESLKKLSDTPLTSTDDERLNS